MAFLHLLKAKNKCRKRMKTLDKFAKIDKLKYEQKGIK